ncbi:MAG: rhodanese-like domain-containing protein [Candidatus Nanoarchaeia archaeon]|nr:rhodanese-like domain-containing protein [Candidatus Nanoarchaeia archaeon]
MFKELSPKEAEKLLENSNGVILDVRTQHEWDKFHLERNNVKLIPVDQLETRYEELNNKSQLIVVTCRAGVRGAAASELLDQKGFTNIVNVQGGLLEWVTYLSQSGQMNENKFQETFMLLMSH